MAPFPGVGRSNAVSSQGAGQRNREINGGCGGPAGSSPEIAAGLLQGLVKPAFAVLVMGLCQCENMPPLQHREHRCPMRGAYFRCFFRNVTALATIRQLARKHLVALQETLGCFRQIQHEPCPAVSLVISTRVQYFMQTPSPQIDVPAPEPQLVS